MFAEFPAMTENKELYIDDLSVPPDSFLYSDDYEHFKYFQKQKDIFKAAVKDTSVIIKDAEIQRFISSNSEYFYTYQLVGDYYFTKGKQEDAKQYYKLALTKEVTTLPERRHIEERLKEISDKELKLY